VGTPASDTLKKYLDLEAELEAWRASHPPDTPDDDGLMDAIEAAWWELSQEDQDWIDARDGVATKHQ
jgi:hypothetical protein